jgi:pentatricopeptide repeat protein
MVEARTLSHVYDSMAYEVSILLVFFLSWVTWQIVKNGNRKPQKKISEHGESQHLGGREGRPRRKDRFSVEEPCLETPKALQSTVMQIMSHSQDQYTKALRMYRDLVRQGEDSKIREEAFYFSLVQASIRVGNADVMCEVLAKARKHRVKLSLQFFQSVLKLLASKSLFKECLHVNEIFGADLPVERTVCSCLTLAASECGEPEVGIKAVDRLRQSGEEITGRDYQNIFRSYAKAGNGNSAQQLFDLLIDSKIPFEAVITNIVLATWITANRTPQARVLLAKAEQSEGAIALDVVSYNTVMKGYAKQHKLKECFDLIKSMNNQGITSDEVTYSTLLDACVAENDFDKATAVIDNFINSGCVMNTVLYTTFMKGFVRMQMLDKAMDLYNQMRNASQNGPGEDGVEPPKPDIILYSVLIKANCDQRQLEPALHLVQDMLHDGLEPDDIIVNRLLDGCRHLSNSELADKIFADFIDSGHIKPTPPTIATMVKIYGKCNRVEHAAQLVRSMYDRFSLLPSVVVYTCLMSCCTRNHRLDLAFEAFTNMVKARVEPDQLTYTTLLKGCMQEKDWARVAELARVATQKFQQQRSSDRLR